jgi:tRNA threonylcarbamoyladenosine biosynthesis protein TsaE
MAHQVRLDSEEDTARVAAAVMRGVAAGDSIGLRGGLGAGKTTFTRYFVEACGGDPAHVSSPSYTLQNEYRLAGGGVVEHWDLYRVKALPLELCEAPPAGVIRVIEWPEQCAEVLQDLQLVLMFRVDHELARSVSFEGTKAGRVIVK